MPFGGLFYKGPVLYWGPKKGPQFRELTIGIYKALNRSSIIDCYCMGGSIQPKALNPKPKGSNFRPMSAFRRLQRIIEGKLQRNLQKNRQRRTPQESPLKDDSKAIVKSLMSKEMDKAGCKGLEAELEHFSWGPTSFLEGSEGFRHSKRTVHQHPNHTRVP